MFVPMLSDSSWRITKTHSSGCDTAVASVLRACEITALATAETGSSVRAAVQMHVVERVDPVAVALVHEGADFVRGVPLLHRRAEVVVVMRKTVKRVDAQHHPADFGAAEFHLGHLDGALRLGRLLRR